MSYYTNYTTVYNRFDYDWVDPNHTRRPEEYPYSHSEYYLWRTFKSHDEIHDMVYTDRMNQWDHEKYQKAIQGKMTNWNSVPKNQQAAQEIVRDYFGEEFECVGIIQSMNVSSGYPLGVFIIKKK